MLIDSLEGIDVAENLVKDPKIAEILKKKPITAIVITHSHADHPGG